MLVIAAQGGVVIVYNWIATYTVGQISPHSWITQYMRDLALPVSFVGTSTDDRRHILPQKEVLHQGLDFEHLGFTLGMDILSCRAYIGLPCLLAGGCSFSNMLYQQARGAACQKLL